ncbi:hypothetical protein BC939DRAFT_473573 [Gamsiella multidivaricata]|uniref:uncharacterized protein n=1 Tax=Gamsiella multidivaricata TaxID=101098 RepID=UPI002220FACF|nr:uncharacterized protein BC939DRAFT_473573 [Gamsiella multidivaricata]KAI7830342.1 hypothetical protein BC939DRAFT_473573 [Gamsiella multidivaricata]
MATESIPAVPVTLGTALEKAHPKTGSIAPSKANSTNGNRTSLSCNGLHDKTQVKLKLQNITQATKPAKNLGDHTHQVFDFQTTVHNMTFDIIKIDVYDVKKAFNQHIKIGRAYLPLRDLQKKVGNKYDNDGDDNTEPEQSVLSTRFDAAAFCKKHDDVFEVDLPLFKHGSYSKFGSSVLHHHNEHDPLHSENKEDIIITKGSENGNDVTVRTHPRRPTRSESYVQMAMNGVEVGMITIQATLHFEDQTQNSLFAHLGTGLERQSNVNGTSASGSNGQDYVSRNATRTSRSHTNRSMDSSLSTDSSTLGDNHLSDVPRYHSEQLLPLASSRESEAPELVKSTSAPVIIQRGIQSGDPQQSGRILKMPSSPPNLPLYYGTASSPTSPPLSPIFPQSPGSLGSPGSPLNSFQWHSDNNTSQDTVRSWDESGLSYGDGYIDGDNAEFDEDIENGLSHEHTVKGEHLTEADRKREEELMAGIMANGDQAKKDMYLNRSGEGQGSGHKGKGKKAKFNLFSEQTRSAFKDIQLMYSSFFGHGWNLSRSEFWKGFHIVEKHYERHPTPTTNRAFDNIDILEKARHFVRLAIASYGSLPWVYFGYSFKVAPLNFVRFNSDRKNVMDYFKLKKEDMIVWHFDKRTALVPSYYIVRDPKYNALCIIIRGTFSITDAMTDLVCEYYPYKGGLVHKGIMDNARFVFERSGKDIEAALKKFNLKTIYW